ncbi:hypothetical protein CCP3SC1_940013 [Gammaproteobacteria bacterium]
MVLFFFIVICVFSFVSYISYHFLLKIFVDNARENIQRISEIQMIRIQELLATHHKNSEVFVLRPSVWKVLTGIDLKQETPRLEKEISDTLLHGYRRIVVFNLDGQIVAPTTIHVLDPSVRLTFQEALQTHDTAVVNPYVAADSDIVYGVVHVVFENGDEKNRVVGAVYFEYDYQNDLYPILQSSTLSSPTMETRLARIEGSDIVLMNRSRFAPKSSPMIFRRPLINGDPDSIMRKALTVGKFGFVKGIDYRDIEVVGDIRSIPGVSWIILTKADRVEIDRPVRMAGWIILVLTFILLTLFGVIFRLFWRRQFLEMLSERAIINERYAVAIETSINGYMLVNIDGQITDCNAALSAITGYTEIELKTLSISDLEALEAPEETKMHIASIMVSSGDSFITQWRKKDGRVIDIQVNVSFSNNQLFVFIQDITERKTILEALNNQFLFQQALVDTIPYPIFYKGPDTCFGGVSDLDIAVVILQTWVSGDFLP